MDAEVEEVLGMDMAPFEALVVQLMSADNDERGHAEQLFNQCQTQHPDALALKLIATLESVKMESRQMSAILLRNVLKDEVSLFTLLNPNTQAAIKTQLLNCVRVEHGRNTLKMLCDTVAELAATLLEDGAWPELLPFMVECVSSQRLQERMLLMFGQLTRYMGPELHRHLATLHAILQQCLSSIHAGSDVWVAALRAAAAIVPTLDTAEQDRFQTLIPGMMETLSIALSDNEEVTVQEALTMFVEIARDQPHLMRKQVPEVVMTVVHIAEAEEFEDATRRLALELFVALARAREITPGMIRERPTMIRPFFATLVKFLVEEVEEDEGVEEEDDEGWQEEDSCYEAGKNGLRWMAILLGRESFLLLAWEVLQAFVSDQDWRKRHAALMTVAQISGRPSKVIEHLDSIVSSLLASFEDPHPRVRSAAVEAMGQLFTNLGPDQLEQHQRGLQAVVRAMDDESPRVQAHAIGAVERFREGCRSTTFNPYERDVFHKLLRLMRNGDGMVHAAASAALKCGTFRERYYEYRRRRRSEERHYSQWPFEINKI